MNLKVGDKVKVIKSIDFPDMVGKVYRVTGLMPENHRFVCRVKDLSCTRHPLMYGWEIEKVFVKGQQLLFNFMD